MRRRHTREITFALFIISILTISNAWAVGTYGGGDGSVGNPFKISTPAHLDEMHYQSEDYNKHFELTADIDMSAYSYTTAVISPDIDSSDTVFDGTAFTGSFNGNGFKIINLTVDGGTTGDYVALFGEISSGAVIANLGLEDCDITGRWRTASLVGHNYYGTITSCYSAGEVAGNYYYTGGLVGYNDHGTVTSCYFAGAVMGGNDNTGGLVGSNRQGSITSCFSIVTVNSSFLYTGGLVGQNNRGTITYCYSIGSVTGGSFYTGGLVGLNGTGTSITSCYSTAAVMGSGGTGGLVGDNWGGSITGCFWDVETSNQTTSDGGTGKDTVDMMKEQTFTDAGWDFVDETVNGSEDIWRIDESKDYPRFNVTTQPCYLTGDYWFGWIGVKLSDHSSACDSGNGYLTETMIALDYVGEENIPTHEDIAILSKRYDSWGWFNMHLSAGGGSEISQFLLGKNILTEIARQPDGDNDLGRTLLVKKAIGVADSDMAGEYGYFGHWQSISPSSAASEFGTVYLNSDHSFSLSDNKSDGGSSTETGTWSFDSADAVVDISIVGEGLVRLQAGHGILMKIDIDPVEDDDLGYSYLVKKGSGKTSQSVVGRYLYQEFSTDASDNEPSTGWGIWEFELDGTWTIACSYNDGTADTDSGTYTVDSDGTIHITNSASDVYNAVLSHDDQSITVALMGQTGDVGIGIAQRSSDCNGNGILDVFEILGDTDGNGIVNFIDFAKLAEYWLEDNCGMCGCADIVCDGKVNMVDLNKFAENWLEGTTP